MRYKPFLSLESALRRWLWHLGRKAKSHLTQALIWGLMFITLALAACGKGNISTPPTGEVSRNNQSATPTLVVATPTQEPVPTPVPTLGVGAASLQGVTLQFWHAASGALGQEVEAVVEDFNRQNPWGITVRSLARSGYDQIYDDMQFALRDKNLPNIVSAYLYQALDWNTPEGPLVDLQPYIDDPVWGLPADEQTDYHAVFWGHFLNQERRLAVPFLGSAQMIYYNRAWAKELGFSTAPITPKDFKQQACAAALVYKKDRDTSNDGKGGLIISLNYSAILGWIHAFGGEVVQSEDGGYRFDTPEVENTFSFLRELYDEGCAWVSDSPNTERDFAARQGLFASGSPPGILYQEDAFVDAASADEWSVIPFPSPSGKPVLEVYGPGLFVMRASPEEQLASWLVVRWLTSPESQGRLARVSGYLPVRASALNYVDPLPQVHPQWKAAMDLLPYAHPEPAYRSWRVARWAVSDAATQVFRYYFQADQIPDLVRLLDQTADDLHRRAK